MTFLDPLNTLAFLQATNPLWVILGKFLICGIAILMLFRLWGIVGLYLYIALATIGGNVAVLKTASLPFLYDKPIALGTVLFMSLFLCSDIINEYFGPKRASQAVWIGFLSYFLFTLFMYMILSFAPLGETATTHHAIESLFLPAPAVFIASLCAYFVSQRTDIALYTFFGKLTKGKHLWFRSLASTFLGSFLDNALFSILLWIVFNPEPKSFETVLWTYILGIYMMRLILSVANIFFMYAVKKFKPPLSRRP